MYRTYLTSLVIFLLSTVSANADGPCPTDVFKTSSGDLKIMFIGHASLLLTFQGKTFFVDPWGDRADYGMFPKADVILVTHEHRDHLDPVAVGKIRTPVTQLLLTGTAAQQVAGGTVMKNGDVRTVEGVTIEAVPAYNIVHKRENGDPFHPRGRGNGYVLTFGGTRVYVAGDTENIPEMAALKHIDIAFLPMNLPYTMTPEMTAIAAKTIRPKVLYPYHYGSTDTKLLTTLLQDEKGIEVRIRPME